MALWLMLAGGFGLATLLASNPVLRQRSPEGHWLWRRDVRTQREDLRLGAALLLLAATAFALICTITAEDHDRPLSNRPAAVVVEPAADDDALNQAGGETAACLIAVAAGALMRSCSTRTTQRLVTYR